MVDRLQLNLMSQIINSMEEATNSLEETSKKGDTKKIEELKREILIFHKQLNEELKKG